MKLPSRLQPLATSLATGGTVLTYHGVQGDHVPRAGTMHVALGRFAGTMRALGGVARFVPLRDLVERHLGGRPTRGLVAVTFDDAYASVVDVAWPVIERYRIPVTLFVVSSAACSGAPFWWDRVEHLFPLVPRARWRAFEEECGLPEDFRKGQPAQLGPLRPLRQWILAVHRGRWPAHLDLGLDRLEAEVGSRTAERPLTLAELDAVASTPLVDVGVHTVSHAVLPLLDDDDLRREVRESLTALRERFADVLPILAPPFGLFDERTVRIARGEGLTACLSLEPALLRDKTPSPLIPRFCMSAGHQPWKAVLHTLGWGRGGRLGARTLRPYPDLPSAST